MPGSKKTPNFEFPYYGALDTFSPLVTYNGLAQQLDNILKTLQTKGEQNGTLIAELQDTSDTIHESVDANTTLIEKINQHKDLWGYIYVNVPLTITPAPGNNNASCKIALNAKNYIQSAIQSHISVENATKTVIGSNTAIDLMSFPEKIPNLPDSAISYETKKQICFSVGFYHDKETNSRIITSYGVYAFRNQNVTKIFILNNTQSLEKISLISLYPMTYTLYPN